MKIIKLSAVFLCVVLMLSSAFCLSGCSSDSDKGAAVDLMADITPTLDIQHPDEAFINAYTNFSIELLKKTVKSNKNSNVLLSPFSASTALGMVANGAAEGTLKELERVLAGGMDIGTYNKFMRGYTFNLTSGKHYTFKNASAIWVDGLDVKRTFLQTNKDYYGAPVFSQPFNDDALRDINNWVKENTDGTIDNMFDEIDPYTKILLVNAVLFDAEWNKKAYNVKQGKFTAIDGEKKAVEMMLFSDPYITCNWGKGFVKYYQGERYKFVALLPYDNVAEADGFDFYEYLNELKAEDLIEGADDHSSPYSNRGVCLPKFTYNFETSLVKPLEEMGIKEMFSEGNLTGISSANPVVTEVKQKTYINVDERGTKASAATSVEGALSAPPSGDVVFDRPFIYMIVDTTSNLPIFIGAVVDIGEKIQ